ncbi:Nramp family divalent metal transporter [Reichenbachiella sp. MALMAid0571]|uniref:Nramp family divalent metal transporter n=1 Tax=Reichenbachiella sp. MALMAid0571 TaxID=3143939 RepID=UPI0032DEA47A
MNKIKSFIATILPGLFLIGLNIGTGSVTAMAKAGANYGLSLTWTIAISCYITYFLINVFGKYTLVTGETALYAFRKHIHQVVGLFFIVALGINVCGSVVGVMGIIADVCCEWSKNYIDGGISGVWFAVFFIGFVYLLFWVGKTKSFEKILAAIVALLSLCFLLNFFILMPPLGELFIGLVPSIPDTLNGTNDTPYLVIASMVGTTVFSGLFIVRTILVKESGWSIKDLKIQKRDAVIASIMMFVISISIMTSASGTLFKAGITLNSASQMLTLLEPLAGTFATTIFAVGIIAAGISSQFPNVILLPMLQSDYNQATLNFKSKQVRLIVLVISSLGLVVPLTHAPPILLMIASQAFGALLLPFTVGCMLYLGNKKDLMKTHLFGMTTNITMVLILLFAIFMSFNGLKGVFPLISVHF